MPKYNIPQYGLLTREEKRRYKPLREVELLFDGRSGQPYRKMKVYVCKCGMKFREATVFRMHVARRHDAHLPYDMEYIPLIQKIEWLPTNRRRKVF